MARDLILAIVIQVVETTATLVMRAADSGLDEETSKTKTHTHQSGSETAASGVAVDNPALPAAARSSALKTPSVAGKPAAGRRSHYFTGNASILGEELLSRSRLQLTLQLQPSPRGLMGTPKTREDGVDEPSQSPRGWLQYVPDGNYLCQFLDRLSEPWLDFADAAFDMICRALRGELHGDQSLGLTAVKPVSSDKWVSQALANLLPPDLRAADPALVQQDRPVTPRRHRQALEHANALEHQVIMSTKPAFTMDLAAAISPAAALKPAAGVASLTDPTAANSAPAATESGTQGACIGQQGAEGVQAKFSTTAICALLFWLFFWGGERMECGATSEITDVTPFLPLLHTLLCPSFLLL